MGVTLLSLGVQVYMRGLGQQNLWWASLPDPCHCGFEAPSGCRVLAAQRTAALGKPVTGSMWSPSAEEMRDTMCACLSCETPFLCHVCRPHSDLPGKGVHVRHLENACDFRFPFSFPYR